MPTKCFTQGSPPPEVRNAKKFNIGYPFYVNTYRNTLKHFIFELKSPIVISIPIHCQAWNYAFKCPLVTDLERWKQGIISYPNKEDRDFLSTQSPSGHSLLIVGWDDDFAMPVRDKDGETVLDDSGNPVMERGFFIAKNSWGTRSLGSKNIYAKGYALISMKYVEEFATAIVSPFRDEIEICDDGKDNNGNNYVDCEDSYCKSNKVCIGKNKTFSTIVEKKIPDGKDSGRLSEVFVNSERVVDRIVISVKIIHPDPSQLVISVKDMTGGDEHVLWDRESAKGGVFQRSFYVGDYWDQMISGVFQLKVRDVESSGVGTLVSWGVTVEPCDGDNCENGYKDVGNYNISQSIPDNDVNGTASAITINDDKIKDVSVFLDIEHDNRGQLVVELTEPNGTLVQVLEATGASGPFAMRELTLPPAVFEAAKGQWTLKVVDGTAGTKGKLRGWGMMYRVAK